MRRLSLLVGLGVLAMPLVAQAQQLPQVTNDDLLRLIGLQQVQNLQCGKALEAVQQEVVKLKPVEKPKEEKK